MKSSSSMTLQFADKIPRWDNEQFESRQSTPVDMPNRRPRHEDSIPTEVRRHIAAHLSASAAPPLGSATILGHINESPYVNQRQKLLWRTLIPGSPSDFNQPSSGLLDLPPELVCLMSDFLDPADMICLGLTCKQLFLAADYHLVDLKNLEFAGGELGQLFGDHQLFEPLARQRYAVKHRLKKDRLADLARNEDTSARLACSVCTRAHPRKFFSPLQRSQPATKRKCLASVAPVRICSHWTEKYATLLARRELSACEPLYRDVHRTQTCSHNDHKVAAPTASWSAPSMLDLGPTFSIERTLAIVGAATGDLTPWSFIAQAIQSEPLASTAICPHIKVGDVLVSESLPQDYLRRPRATSGEQSESWTMCVPDVEPVSCDTCGTMWQFNMTDYSVPDSLQPRLRVNLIVDEQVKVTRNPWTKEFLRNVEGGDELIRLLPNK